MLVSFVRPGGGVACVGLLSPDGGRVADLTAIGMEDVYAALPRVAQLEKLQKHLTLTAGAVVYPVGNVRLLAPVPYARLVRDQSSVPAGAPEEPELAFADPREIAGPGAHLTVGADELLVVGIAAAIGTGGRDLAAKTAASHIAGVTLFAEWRGSGAPVDAAGDRLVVGPALAPLAALDDENAIVVTVPHESTRHVALTGVRSLLTAAVRAASRRYTLRAGDLFLHDVGVVEAPLSAGEAAEIVIEGPSGALSHVATRAI
ncbi:MAG TPA: fumarylacetoacetate hydrolase family protein [Gemmatimonadaceae bacterium]|nr:fumarylacetoacetate hydrolase family protein [Gemmatimonadaceae bacterium]